MLTAVAAVALAWCEPRAVEAMRIAANTLGTDTDTIATMSGAILGATVETDPPVDVLDAALVRSDADRLADIAVGSDPASHQYPDLMHWLAPKTRSDALACSKDGGLVVRGLGHATRLKDEPELAAHGFRWRWVRLDCGQTLLVKGREDLLYVDDGSKAACRGSARDPSGAVRDAVVCQIAAGSAPEYEHRCGGAARGWAGARTRRRPRRPSCRLLCPRAHPRRQGRRPRIEASRAQGNGRGDCGVRRCACRPAARGGSRKTS